ncbi:MAG: phosphotransferase family protein [Candidatus Thorarchaeota archaeon]
MDVSEFKRKLCYFYEVTSPEYQNVEITQIIDITSGWETDLLSFDLYYEIQGEQVTKELVARIYPATDSEVKSTKEFNVMKKLYDLNYPVPRMEKLESSGKILGNPFVIMERIHGPTMGKILINSSEKKRIKLMNSFIDLYIQLHSLNWKEFELTPSLSQSLHSYITNLLNDYYSSSKKRGMRDFNDVFDLLRNQMEGISIPALSLIHLDYHPHNILMKENTKPVVIDWGTSRVLDFRFDLAWTVLLANAHYSPSMGQEIFELYQQKLGKTIKNFNFFYMFAATRRLIDYAISMTQGAELSGMRPETTTTLKEYNQVYRFVYDELQKHLNVRIGIIEELLSK